MADNENPATEPDGEKTERLRPVPEPKPVDSDKDQKAKPGLRRKGR